MRRGSMEWLGPVTACALLLALLLAGCETLPAVSDPSEARIRGTGTLEGQEVIIASELGGRIAEIAVREGDAIAADELLLRLDSADAEVHIARAGAAVAMAEAHLSAVKAGPRAEEIAAAEALVESAQARLWGADRAVAYALRAISDPVDLDMQITQARLQVGQAEQALERAHAALDAEKLNYHIYVDLKSEVSAETRRTWDLRVRAAEAGIAQAEAALSAAEADLQALLALRSNPLLRQAELNAARSTYTATLAAVDVAQAELVSLRAGSRPEEIRIAEAQLEQARAALSLALIQEDLLTLTAPISAHVTSLGYHPGEVIAPGVPILTLTNLEDVYLTLYVPEARIAEVSVGQAVEVSVDAYPGLSFEGRVSRIATRAEYTPRGVETVGDRARRVFAVQIRVPNPGYRLRPGMPAQGVFLTE